MLQKIREQAGRLAHDPRGMVSVTGVVLLAVIMVTIIVSVVIFYSVADSITMSSSTGQAQINNTTNQASQVFNLMNVIPIVAIAGLIISILLGYMGFAARE